MLLASTREGLANADTWKVLTRIQVSKSILQLAATNCVYIYICMVYGHAFQSKKGYALLMRTKIQGFHATNFFQNFQKIQHFNNLQFLHFSPNFEQFHKLKKNLHGNSCKKYMIRISLSQFQKQHITLFLLLGNLLCYFIILTQQ